jgi:hypothetical protein
MVSSAKTGRPENNRLRIANEKPSSRKQLIAFSLMPYPVSDSVLFWIKTVHRAKVESIQRLRRGAPHQPARGPARPVSASSMLSSHFSLSIFSHPFIIVSVEFIYLS